MTVSVAADTVEGLVGAAVVRAVLLGACPTGVLHLFAFFGVVTPLLAFKATDRFLFVFV